MIELKKDKIYKQLRNDIASGKYRVNQKLPNELDFSRELGISKKTLRHALGKLEDEGLVARHKAKGTFVLDPQQSSKNKMTNIMVIGPREHGPEIPYNYLLPGIQDAALENNINLEHCPSEFLETQTPEFVRNTFQEKNISGFIYCDSFFQGQEPTLKALAEVGVPGVIPHTWRRKDRVTTSYPILLFDEKNSFKQALKHLAEQGHQRVGLIMKQTDSKRFRGYTTEELFHLLENLNLDTSPELFNMATYDQSEINTIVAKMMTLPAPPTAIMCYSDFYAVYVYKSLKTLNISIPDEVAVMGYCGYPGSQFFDPPLSTIDLQYQAKGRAAIKLLMESDKWFNTNDSVAPPEIVVPHKLITRQSTAVKRIEQKLKDIL